MGGGGDIEKDGKEQHLLEPGRAAAISKQLHANLLPIFLLMTALCYLDRWGGPAVHVDTGQAVGCWVAVAEYMHTGQGSRAGSTCCTASSRAVEAAPGHTPSSRVQQLT